MFRVAIVGRPNVGKSSLFNRLVGKRKAIVEDIPGVTRDRIVSTTDWRGVKFEVVDTGGYITSDEDKFAPYIRKQVEKELEEADLLVLVVDGKQGITPLDKEIATMLHKTEKPVIVAVNKIDDPEKEKLAYEFYELGFDEVVPISTIQKFGVAELLDKIYQHIPDYEKELEYEEEEEEQDYIKVAIVGKPNAGKSSLLNAILGEERVLVSEIPGTTRDTVDTLFEKDGQKFLFLDTAGIRKKSKVEYGVEFFSVGRSIEAIEKADVVVLVIDATQGATEQDQKIAGLIQRRYKPAVIVINKIDMLKEKEIEKVVNQVKEKLYFLSYAPIVLTSAAKKIGIDELLNKIVYVYQQAWKRVGTGQLNRAIRQVLALRQPPSYQGKPLKIYYATQLEGKPPAFLLFVNKAEGFKENYVKFLEANLRKLLGLENAPIKLIFRGKEEERE
ncbi:MAG: ribosome biogenesis GTPase Der [Sulfurihydrogenibium sp.]|uniref:ribosome biogenesis GTPase Der n=1 Tax=Sulfurihydrogenibium sp. TaxID=2053621 RepID=UPI000CB0E998|nr:MAG: ribosome biogenesis GTPase Der [Sulfurihydrogenibium sp.]